MENGASMPPYIWIVRSTRVVCLGLIMIGIGALPAFGQHGGGGHSGGGSHGGGSHGGGSHGSPGHRPGGGGIGSPVYIPGGYFPVVFLPPPIITTPPPIVVAGGGLMLPTPPPTPPVRLASAPSRATLRAQAAKAENYVTLGDNLFRARNYHRAEQRYVQAANTNPSSAAPHVRIAQLALIRGDFAEAAAEYRAAMAAEPGWLLNAGDVQRLFPEPADFSQAVAKLEAHLQATPGDRDGWLVLGAEWYLSGRARQSADVFTRLNDRKPDATLAAFLDATSPDAMPRDAR
jgi:tetratricopeptide (TPR) repeat protein